MQGGRNATVVETNQYLIVFKTPPYEREPILDTTRLAKKPEIVKDPGENQILLLC